MRIMNMLASLGLGASIISGSAGCSTVLGLAAAPSPPIFAESSELRAQNRGMARGAKVTDSAGDAASPTTAIAGSIGTASTPVLATGEPAAAAEKPQDPRQVIYSAGYRLVVADVPGTLRSIQSAAEKQGGFMQEITGGSIIVRVPASHFADACKSIEESGEVVDRQVKAQDVTEQMIDLHIHLENAEKLRQQLIDILAKTQKVEDALKVEAELARVAEQIDQAKGKIRYFDSQIAMSSIRVDLNAAVAQNGKGNAARLPFSWIEELGDGLVVGQVQQSVRPAGFLSSGPSFKPPAGFVRYYEESSQTEGMDASGMLLRVERHANVDKANLDFWSKLARKQLVDQRSLAVAGEENDGKSYVLRGTRDVGGKQFGYLLTVRRSDSAVMVFESWGPADVFEKSLSAIRGSGLSTEP